MPHQNTNIANEQTADPLIKDSESQTSKSEKWGLDRDSYVAIVLTYIAYLSFYLVRKPMSTSKPYIKQQFHICSKLTLSIIDNCHLVPYSIVAMLFPNLVDKLRGRKGCFAAFFFAGLAVASIYFIQFLGGNNQTQFVLICFCIFISGSSQAFGWPAAVKALSENVYSEQRKAILPAWTTCCFLGSTLGGIFLGAIYVMLGSDRAIEENYISEDFISGNKCNNTNLLYLMPSEGEPDPILENNKPLDWRMSFLIPAGIPIFMAIMILFFMPDGKKDVEEAALLKSENDTTENQETEKVGMKQIITEVPAIIPLALAYACAKGSRYWYFYWAPSWLIEAGDFDTAQASFISSAIDIGSIFGLFIIGPLTTKNRFMSKPIPPLYAAFASTTCCIPVIFLARLVVLGKNVYAVFAVLFLLGAVVAISDPLYSGVVACEAADLHGKNSHAGVTGFINGVGSMGAVLLNPLATYLGEQNYLYAIMTVGVALSICAVLTLVAHKRLELAKRLKRTTV